MIKRALYIICLISFFGLSAVAENPKREVRSVWLSTVWRLDWPAATVPAATGSNEAARESARNSQKNGLISILNKLESANFNTVYFQVRGMSDAFYDSAYEPWSQYLSSERGADPGWDPLAFLIEEAHARGIEVHAWLNPYRYSTSDGSHGNLPTDYANTHPAWLLDYGSFTKILNPGMPEVRERICDIVEDIIVKYDVDGIVFDDYFYVQGTTNAMDQAQYDAYNPNGLARGDWRRENVNMMVRDVYERINSIKPYLPFGISPAGVSASSTAVAEKYGVPKAPAGSDWQYNGIFSDPLAWIKAGTIDYVSPQIYWTVGSGNDYSKLSPWWANVANFFGRYYYSSNTSSFSTNEVMNQIQINRDADLNGVTGSVYFRTQNLPNATINAMKDGPYSTAALTAAYGWKDAPVQGLVENLAVSGQQLSWNYSVALAKYVVYAIPNANKNDADIYTSPKYIQGVSYDKSFTLKSGISSATHKIAVAVYDRFGNEYPPRVLGASSSTVKAATLTYPANQQEIVLPAIFSWKAVSGASYYIWEISEDESFTKPIESREVAENEFGSGTLTSLKDNTVYYWRVKTVKENAPISISEVRSFNGTKFKINSPADGTEQLPLTTAFSWSDIGEGASYTLEISANSNFSALAYTATTANTNHTVASGYLSPSTAYYARVKAERANMQAMSERISFTTVDADIPVPVIVSPSSGTTIYGTEIELSWQEQLSKGFRAELSQNAGFPTRGTTVKGVEAHTYTALFDNLQAGVYHLRVKAGITGGWTDPSEYVTVTLDTSSTDVDITGENENGLTLTKNSKSDFLLEVISSENAEAKITIYSTSGMLMNSLKYNLSIGNNSISLNLKSLESGTYILQLETDKLSEKIKFIK